MSKKKRSAFRIDPQLQALIDRGEASKKAGEEMKRRLERLIGQLRKKFPEHNKALAKQVEGQWQWLLSDLEKTKRRERGVRRLQGGHSSGDNGSKQTGVLAHVQGIPAKMRPGGEGKAELPPNIKRSADEAGEGPAGSDEGDR